MTPVMHLTPAVAVAAVVAAVVVAVVAAVAAAVVAAVAANPQTGMAAHPILIHRHPHHRRL